MRLDMNSDAKRSRFYRSNSEEFRMRGTGENMDGGVGFHFTGGAEGLGSRDQSHPLSIGMEEATER